MWLCCILIMLPLNPTHACNSILSIVLPGANWIKPLNAKLRNCIIAVEPVASVEFVCVSAAFSVKLYVQLATVVDDVPINLNKYIVEQTDGYLDREAEKKNVLKFLHMN